MKKLKFLVLLLLLTTSINTLFADGKRYQLKSGIVEYKIEGGGNIMGFSNKTTGSEKLIFKDWGNLEIREEKSSTNTMGNIDNIHNLVKIDHGKVYSVDFKNRVIIQMDPAMLAQSKDKDMTKMGKDMMISMGGKKVGEGKVLGYSCEIWELMGAKTWLYKGIALKTEANMMGIKHLSVATKAEFDIPISDTQFKLPNYPIQTMDQIIENSMHQKDRPTKDIPAQMPSPEEMEQLKGFMKNLGGMFGK